MLRDHIGWNAWIRLPWNTIDKFKKIKNLTSYSLWCNDMKTLSTLMTLCEGNPLVTGECWRFLCYIQIVVLLVVLDTMATSLVWYVSCFMTPLWVMDKLIWFLFGNSDVRHSDTIVVVNKMVHCPGSELSGWSSRGTFRLWFHYRQTESIQNDTTICLDC